MRTLRIFPRQNKATPRDEGVVIDRLPGLLDEADRVQISVTFDWDRSRAETLAKYWRAVAPVEVDGPAYGNPGEEFVPGHFLRHGYIITSRGCPNRCLGCKVPEREGPLRLLPIRDGWDVLDNNLLACPKNHIESVFRMLMIQPERPRFTGGLEARRIRSWHVDWLTKLNPFSIWMAYDKPGDFEPLRKAVQLLTEADLIGPHRYKRVGSYVLMGYGGDTIEKAEQRLKAVIGLGIRTQAMWWDNGMASDPKDFQRWKDLRRHYTDPRVVGKMVEKVWDRTCLLR